MCVRRSIFTAKFTIDRQRDDLPDDDVVMSENTTSELRDGSSRQPAPGFRDENGDTSCAFVYTIRNALI